MYLYIDSDEFRQRDPRLFRKAPPNPLLSQLEEDGSVFKCNVIKKVWINAMMITDV